jgi:hypothetical protein
LVVKIRFKEGNLTTYRQTMGFILQTRKEIVSVLETCTFRLPGKQCSGKQIIISCELMCVEMCTSKQFVISVQVDNDSKVSTHHAT